DAECDAEADRAENDESDGARAARHVATSVWLGERGDGQESVEDAHVCLSGGVRDVDSRSHPVSPREMRLAPRIGVANHTVTRTALATTAGRRRPRGRAGGYRRRRE